MGAMDELIDPAVVARLRSVVAAAAPAADLPAMARAEHEVPGRRLRERVDLVRDALLSDVPADFPVAERIVGDILDDPRFAGWMIWPVSEFVAIRALESGSTAHFDAGMDLLARLTVGLTGEFAVRDLLIARPERGLAVMRSWTTHENEHVRRLATEGSRTYLPWAKRVPWLLAHPRATRAILDASYRDPTEYVRRSAGNHLNDLSRVDPGVVIEIATAWAAGPDGNTAAVLRRGLRTLAKRGEQASLALLGFDGADLRVSRPRLSSGVVPWGGAVDITAEVSNDGESDATVAIDYSVGFQRADGSVRPKVFKLASRRIAAGESVVVTKTHSFLPITTRTYYPGPHVVTVQANGLLSAQEHFVLTGPDGIEAGRP